MAKANKSGSEKKVKLAGGVTLARASEVKAELLDALTGASRLHLDLTAVDEMDVAGVQLLCALHRSAVRQGKGLEITAEGRSTLVAELSRAVGFPRHKGCAEGCLWQEGTRG